MLKRYLHTISANPKIYDAIQYLAGVGFLHRKLEGLLNQLVKANYLILDIGGGTGLIKRVCHSKSNYICLDIDISKLKRFRQKNLDGKAIAADGTVLPIKHDSIDVLLYIFIIHHLDNENLVQLISESERVLKPNGHLMILDPIWVPNRPAGVLLWKYDRGSYPRTKYDLEMLVAPKFNVLHRENIKIFHEYSILIASKS
jgi:ubiquinone/menaquinone biosynthesis C-methylase UbiE